MIFLFTTFAYANPMIGADIKPISRGDIAWVENKVSDRLLFETDGMLGSNFRPWLGWEFEKPSLRVSSSLDLFYQHRTRRIDETDVDFQTGVMHSVIMCEIETILSSYTQGPH